jgi:hypothetical protein
MIGTLGIGGLGAGAFLWARADGQVEANLGHLSSIAPAVPGLLILMGTALLGFALIRMQKP